MTKQEIAALAVRVLALWTFTEVGAALATLAVGLLAMIASGQLSATLAAMISGIPSIALCVIGIWLWNRADYLAVRMVGAEVGTVAGCKATSDELLAVACCVLGMYFLVAALPEIVKPLAQALYAQVPLREAWKNSNWQIRLWIPVFQSVLGAWLLLGSRGIARTVRQLQRQPVEPGPKGESSAAE